MSDHPFDDTWNRLDILDEQITLEYEQKLENLKKTYLQVSSKSKGNRSALDKRREEVEKKIRESRNSVPTDYVLKDTDTIDQQFVEKMLKEFQTDKILHIKFAYKIVETIIPYLKENGALNKIEIPNGGRIVVVGDIHGQLPDLFTILSLTGFPSPTNYYLFNGDMVDRGPHGPEVIFTIYALKIAFPKFVFINRGNHELRRMNEKYDFKSQIIEKYEMRLFDEISDSFLWLPFSSLINSKVFVVHGGLFPLDYGDITINTLEGLSSELGKPVPTHKRIVTLNEKLVENMLWSDPQQTDDPSKPIKPTDSPHPSRGAGCTFGKEELRKFLRINQVDVVVRSHQLVEEGYQQLFGKALVTLFSASYYTGKNDNKGAIAIFKHDQANWREPQFIQYYGSILQTKTGPVDSVKIKENQQQDSLHRLYELIYDNAHKLQLSFEAKAIKITDKENVINSYVTYENWEKTLTSVLDLHIQWHTLFPYLVLPKHTYKSSPTEVLIDYVKFLGRFYVNLDERLKEWQDDIVNTIVTNIVVKKQTLKQAFEEYDTNKDKTISYAEFWNAMQKLNLGGTITEQQCYDIMAAVDVDHNGFIDYGEFKAHFGPKFERFQNASEWVKQTVAELSTKLIAKHKTIKQSFMIFDGDRDHRITYREFSDILRRDLDGNKYTQDQRHELFNYVDENLSGAISYKEFKTAFEGANAEKFSKRQAFELSVKNMVMHNMCEAIRKSRTQLYGLFVELDKSKEALINVEEFVDALQSLNLVISSDPDMNKHTIAQEQMKKLHAIMDSTGSGCINYKDFLQMFNVHVKNN